MSSKTTSSPAKPPRYWVCIIGPVPDADLPAGADLPPRLAARRAVALNTGHDPECFSGWHSEATVEDLKKVLYSNPDA